VVWRERIVRRFAGFSDGFPWPWTAVDVEDWTSALVSRSGHSHTTIRCYQGAVACFLDYVPPVVRCGGRRGEKVEGRPWR
jgi:integrase/recombinase XerC